MVLPPKLVQADYYVDGGTVRIRVTDQRGAIHSVTFPFDHDGVITFYKTAFNGDRWNTPPLKDPARAKTIMIRLLKDYGDKRDEYYESTFRKFSEPPSEIGEKIYRDVRKIFD
jgi:hypothetical protein